MVASPEPKKKVIDLDVALQMDPPLSPVVEFPYNGQTVGVVFRIVPDPEKDLLRLSAEEFLAAERAKRTHDGQPWEERAEATTASVQTNRWDLLVIHAAARKASNPEFPAATLGWIEKLPSHLQAYLGEAYATYESTFSPDIADDETVETCIELVKKNAVVEGSLWTLFGSLTLESSLRTMVARCYGSPTESSSGGASGARKSSNGRKKKTSATRAKPRKRKR